jgi:hypothetical protein
MIKRAAEKRKEQREQIQEERESYEQDLRKQLEEQDREMNPDKYKHQKSFQEQVEEKTIPGQVVKNRKDLQKGRQHMTPQGMVNFSDEEENGEEPN